MQPQSEQHSQTGSSIRLMYGTPISLLAGDVGGTKTTLALYEGRQKGESPLRKQTYQNARFSRFEDLVRAFLAAGHSLPCHCCLGIAGPVLADQVQMTNLNWTIAANALAQEFGFARVDLINDLVATGLGAILLPENELRTLNAGTPVANGSVALLAPGTGLGEAFLLNREGCYLPVPSEGGHASFSPRTQLQIDLLTYMFQRHSHVSVEQVCSGIAIPDLFDFLQTRLAAPAWLLARMAENSDRTPLIVQAAIEALDKGPPCDIAIETLRLFTDILADEAANLTLKTLSLGGLYLGGGLSARIGPFLEPERFMATFSRGIYRELLDRIPIRIILNPDSSLLGAAFWGFGKMGEGTPPFSTDSSTPPQDT